LNSICALTIFLILEFATEMRQIIANCRLPIDYWRDELIGNRQLAIGNGDTCTDLSLAVLFALCLESMYGG
jgi:hypothetical protein